MSGEATVEQPDDSRTAVLIFAGAVALLGGVAWLAPSLLARRFAGIREQGQAVALSVRALGPALLAMGLGAWVTSSPRFKWTDRTVSTVFGLLVLLGYLSVAHLFADWMVDDAAITFAYSKNLAAGHGIVIHAGHAPEEGYSTTLWMLFLAAARWMGADIATTAKRACILLGASAIWMSQLACQAIFRAVFHANSVRRPVFSISALGAATALGAPFVIWSASGLEHSLQAVLFGLIVCAPTWPRFKIPVITGALSALVLTRPEAPILVVLVGAVLVLENRLDDRSWLSVRLSLRRCWPVFVFPFVTWVLLSAFRLAYFHDLLSNPYYAKASKASWLRVVNVVGGGWSYLFGWLADARTWLLVPILLFGRWQKGPQVYRLAVAVCLAQLLFMLFVGGDWMDCYRFVAPALPSLAVVTVYSIVTAGTRWNGASTTAARLLLVCCLGLGTVGQLVAFRARPTTPTAVVALIGRTFVDLGHRLGIEHPSLAHHDAGGTSYDADIELVDLAGLADRDVAKHMSDAEFMRRYIFEQRRPTFVFGKTTPTFATGKTQFFRMPEFSQYVPVRFPGRPFMTSDLCHVRRDAIHAAPGIRYVNDGTGEYWVVDDASAVPGSPLTPRPIGAE